MLIQYNKILFNTVCVLIGAGLPILIGADKNVGEAVSWAMGAFLVALLCSVDAWMAQRAKKNKLQYIAYVMPGVAAWFVVSGDTVDFTDPDEGNYCGGIDTFDCDEPQQIANVLIKKAEERFGVPRNRRILIRWHKCGNWSSEDIDNVVLPAMVRADS